MLYSSSQAFGAFYAGLPSLAPGSYVNPLNCRAVVREQASCHSRSNQQSRSVQKWTLK
jgi:hypothetical protein